MTFTSLSELSDTQKSELVASLASIIAASNSGGEVTSEVLTAVADASGNSLAPSWAALFASVVARAGGVEKFCLTPGSGGGGGGGAVAAADSGAAAAVEEKEEEEEEMDLGGGMDMFGAEEGGGGGDY